MPEKTVKFYAEDEVVFEWSSDGLVWHEVEHYDEAPTTGCREAKVDVPSGWVRARTLFGNPEQYDTPSNNLAVPEPAWVGLTLGVLLLAGLGRRRRAC